MLLWFYRNLEHVQQVIPVLFLRSYKTFFRSYKFILTGHTSSFPKVLPRVVGRTWGHTRHFCRSYKAKGIVLTGGQKETEDKTCIIISSDIFSLKQERRKLLILFLLKQLILVCIVKSKPLEVDYLYCFDYLADFYP